MGMESLLVTIKIKATQLEALKKYYEPHARVNNGAYILFFAIRDQLSITVYRSNKDLAHYKVVFHGPNAEIAASKWAEIQKVSPKKTPTPKTKASTSYLDFGPQYGSDEVGFGDFFGPLVVVASYLDEAIYSSLQNLAIKDSKKLTDDYILSIGPLLVAKIKHKVNIVSNPKFNELIKKGYNMNKMKAMLHHQVLSLLQSSLKITAPIYIDQFCSPLLFSKYTEGMPALPNVRMETKGESLFPSVALSSILARYYFLIEIEKLNQQYQITIPLGAGTQVDIFAKTLLKKHGITVLNQIVKQNFVNYKRLVT